MPKSTLGSGVDRLSLNQDLTDQLKSLQDEVNQKILGRSGPKNALQLPCKTANLLAEHFPEHLQTDAPLDRVWKVINVTNKFYREELRKLDRKTRPVERRKLRVYYLEFLSSAQSCFANHIAILIDLPSINETVRRTVYKHLDDRDGAKPTDLLRLPALTTENPYLTRSCYDACVRLGDCSRYREQVRRDRFRIGHALRWLDLAVSILPTRGTAYYQRAVAYMMLDDLENQLQAIWNLYRAATVSTPITGAVKTTLRAVLEKHDWSQSDEQPSDSGQMHPLLLYKEPGWAARVLRGSLFKAPFVKDGFQVEESGVSRITIADQSV